MKIRLPVRSAIYKHDTGGLVVRWVTTSESPLLYVSGLLFASSKSINRHRHREKPTQIAQEDSALHCFTLVFAPRPES